MKTRKTYKCKTCGASFTQHENLNRYIATVREEKKPSKCNICDLNVTTKQNLNTQEALIHAILIVQNVTLMAFFSELYLH
jgi:DNA-directed RNA polymerase subunit RPC12/RpoP